MMPTLYCFNRKRATDLFNASLKTKQMLIMLRSHCTQLSCSSKMHTRLFLWKQQNSAKCQLPTEFSSVDFQLLAVRILESFESIAFAGCNWLDTSLVYTSSFFMYKLNFFGSVFFNRYSPCFTGIPHASQGEKEQLLTYLWLTQLFWNGHL